jgi:hypothetical protein
MPLESISLQKSKGYLSSISIEEKNKDINPSFIKMVYGIENDVNSFKENKKNTISLDDLNLMCSISAEKLISSPKILMEEILSGTLKIDPYMLNFISKNTSISIDLLMRASENWIRFLETKKNDFSLSLSLKNRAKKSEFPVIDFILKNSKVAINDGVLSNEIIKAINADSSNSKTIESIFNAFLDSDEKGFEIFNKLSLPPNLGRLLFSSAITTFVIRKISKLGIDFSQSPDGDFINLIFVKPTCIKDQLINVSNEDKWRGKKDFTGIGNIFEPITFSELRHIKRNNYSISYVDNYNT